MQTAEQQSVTQAEEVTRRVKPFPSQLFPRQRVAKRGHSHTQLWIPTLTNQSALCARTNLVFWVLFFPPTVRTILTLKSYVAKEWVPLSSQYSRLRAPHGPDALLHSLMWLSRPIFYYACPLPEPGFCKVKSKMLSLLVKGLFAFEAGPMSLVGLKFAIFLSPMWLPTQAFLVFYLFETWVPGLRKSAPASWLLGDRCAPSFWRPLKQSTTAYGPKGWIWTHTAKS